MSEDHMMHGSSDIKHNKQSFLSFGANFCPLTLLTIEKNQNFEKMKKVPGDIIPLHLRTTNDIPYDVWFLKYQARHT